MKSFCKTINNHFLLKEIEIGSKFIRLRMHNESDQLFKHKEDLTYPPANKAVLMRANFNNQPMFYGSIFSENEKKPDTPRFTCLCETCKEVRDDSFVGKKDFSYSLWINKKPIKLFIIPVFDSYEKPPIDFKWYFNFWKSLIKAYSIPSDTVEELKELSKKFSYIPVSPADEVECYTYTATFTQQLLDAHHEIDGIMYPSARLGSDGLGINVVIRPEVIDNYFDFTYSSICHLFKRSRELQTVLTYKRSHIAQNGKISYSIDRDYFRAIDYLNSKSPSYNTKELKFKY